MACATPLSSSPAKAANISFSPKILTFSLKTNPVIEDEYS